jgi:lincosamide and streptogramin A transport system ATP-binding/permease protein
MSLIDISHLTFSYEGHYEDIFTDVSIQLDTDWKLGLCGRNGRGKTTLLKLLMGEYEYQGTISASVNFSYFPFVVADPAAAVQDILSEISPDAQVWEQQKELSLLGLDHGILWRSFHTLSNGEQTKVLLAGLFLRENQFLLIDEPTNHLDLEARRTVARYLKGKSGFILVSHDRTFLDEATDHTLSINKNNVEVIKGNFSIWWQQKQQQDEFEQAQNEKLQKDIRRLEAAAKQSAQWASSAETMKMGKGSAVLRKKGHQGMDAMAYYGEKSRRMQQRRKNLERRQQGEIQEKSKLLKNLESKEELKLLPLTYHTNRLITLDHISLAYDERTIFQDVNLSLEHGDRLALRGSNGSGKSSLLKLILGEAIPCIGDIHIANKLIISYVPQDPSFLTGRLEEYAKEQDIDETLFKTILRKLDFGRTQFEKDMRDYSAGQKKKVLLAGSLCKRAHVYIWDEPLNYVDVLSRMQIEELLLEAKPTMLFVEHDQVFCDKIATKTIEL